MRHPDGPAPRFGSCYLVLRPEVSRRCTFTYLDSCQNPDEVGTLDELDDIVSALVVEVFSRNSALGKSGLTVPKLMSHLAGLDASLMDPSETPACRNLDHYIEAQVHGDVLLGDDVERLVADPSFKGTSVGDCLEKICGKYDIELYWHCGFALPIEEVPDDFRGPTMPSLARRISSQGYVDIAMIGAAAASLRQEPQAWTDRGSSTEVLQELKTLWHVLVRYGRPLKTMTLVSCQQRATPVPSDVW